MYYYSFFITTVCMAFSATVGGASTVHPRTNSSSGVIIPLYATYTSSGTQIDAPITIGDQEFLLFMDTGSADTWVAQTGYQCINVTDNFILSPASDFCEYTNTYNISSTFQQLSNQTFGVKYGGGIAEGLVGYEEVTFGGLTLDKQEIGVANSLTNIGDGVNSGILGLAYPADTSAHPGPNYPNASDSLWENRIVYNPLFNSLYTSGLVDPYFSIALDRPAFNVSNGPGGTLALGTLPPNITYNPTFAISPNEILGSLPDLYFPNNVPQLSYWALTIKSTIYGSSSNSTPYQVIIDTGNFVNWLPAEIALAANQAFSPPATRNIDFLTNGQYDVACNATPPRFGLQFQNNVTIYLNPLDLIVQNVDGSCGSLIGDSSQLGIAEGTLVPFFILGTPFFRSVLAVFDFGNNELRFAERTNANVTMVTGAPGKNSTVTSDAKSERLVNFVFLTAVILLCEQFLL